MDNMEAVEKYNMSVALNWIHLMGSERACFCHRKAWNEK